jgi:ribonuclease J
MMTNLQILPLGGMGKVTQNMFLYMYDQEILIVDCGIGFPDTKMPGVDILIPDTRHLLQLLEEGKKIVGMVLTHGHDDHIAATPYILPELPEFPIYASALTAGFAKNRMKDSKLERPITVVKDKTWQQIGTHFEVFPIAVTHSVPDTRHYGIRTPEGTIYHGSDFKLDKDPVDGILTDEAAIAELGKEKILCLMIDCLRVERRDWVGSESSTGPVIEAAFLATSGKMIVTLMSSHIHRIQQTVDAAVKVGRKIIFVGRSVEQNVEVALRLGKLKIPQGVQIDKKQLRNVSDDQLCVIIAGSQGQEGSSLMRAVYGEHRVIQIKPDDKVVFSADAIPGNELPYFDAIDELCRNGVQVLYPAVEPGLHQSGHASAPEQQHILQLIKPEYVMPIGGADRHRVKFIEYVTEPLDFPDKNVLLPVTGEIVTFADHEVDFVGGVQIEPRIVDGLGVGDVGPRVLSDRRVLGASGMLILLIPREKGRLLPRKMKIISRGFVFMKEATEVIDFIKKSVGEISQALPNKIKDSDLKFKMERRLSRRLYKVIRREPMIVVDILDR